MLDWFATNVKNDRDGSISVGLVKHLGNDTFEVILPVEVLGVTHEIMDQLGNPHAARRVAIVAGAAVDLFHLRWSPKARKFRVCDIMQG